MLFRVWPLVICAFIAPELVDAKGSHAIVKTYLESGSGGQSLQAGANLVRSVSVTCQKHYASCTLALSAMNEICVGSAGYSFETTVTVDGNAVDPGLWMLEAGNCGGATWANNYVVSPGKHKVQLYTNWSGKPSATQGPWSIRYEVAVP